jgi:hypothetical protein
MSPRLKRSASRRAASSACACASAALWKDQRLMSRRTERPYKVDGTDKLAPHSAVRCSVPEINGPVVQREFSSLLRETCGPGLPATARLAASNGGQAGTGVSRGRSTESYEPETKRPDGLTTREGLNLAGRHDHRGSCPGALTPTGRAPGSDHRGRERVLLRPQGLSGTAARGPACTVVWEAGGNPPGDPIRPRIYETH